MTETASDEHLTTGWEPDLAVDDTILRRFVFAMADRVAAMASALAGRTARDERAVMADTGSSFFFDQAVVLLQPLTADALQDVVADAIDFYGPQRSWVLFSAWPTPDLRDAGLSLLGHPPMMIRAPGPDASGAGIPPEGVEIVEVEDSAQLADFERTLVAGYPMSAAGALVIPDLLGDPFRLFLAYDGSDPIAVAGASLFHGIAEIDWVATIPAARGRGVGAAVTWAATTADPSRPAVLLSSDPGRSVYERLGYLPIARFTGWQRAAG
jgi:GNAT superfamily N-acetyltransferase